MASSARPVAVLDACVLFPMLLRDVLLTLAEAGLYGPRWSEEILDEVARNLRTSTGMTEAQVAHALGEMRRAFPDALVSGHDLHLAGLQNHPKDRHVVAAALEASASNVVTLNLRDFLPNVMPEKVSAVSPDDFLVMLLEHQPVEVLAALRRQAARFTRRPTTLVKLIEGIQRAAPKFGELASRALAIQEGTARPQLPAAVRTQLERIQRLGKRVTADERLDAFRAVGASGALPDDAALYLIAWALQDFESELFTTDADPEVARIRADLADLERQYGLAEDEYWPIGEAPADVEKLSAEYEHASDRARARLWRAKGEVDMAELYEAHRAEYERRIENGRRYFFGGDPLSVLLH